MYPATSDKRCDLVFLPPFDSRTVAHQGIEVVETSRRWLVEEGC